MTVNWKKRPTAGYTAEEPPELLRHVVSSSSQTRDWGLCLGRFGCCSGSSRGTIFFVGWPWTLGVTGAARFDDIARNAMADSLVNDGRGAAEILNQQDVSWTSHGLTRLAICELMDVVR